MDAFVPEVAPPPLLECRDLTKRYGATVALDRFTVSLPAGRIVGLAFLSLTLGAWWARRHKVAAAVALYVGIGWVISLLFSIVGVLAMVGDTGTASFMLGVVSVMQTVVNLAVAGGGVALSAYLVRAKVDLS